MTKQFNLAKGRRAERKMLVTIAEWNEFDKLTAAPDDWATKYNDYYTKQANGYVKNDFDEAPTFGDTDFYRAIPTREILGTRTEDSSIEYNSDIETTTDILGNNYTDLNKTQPEQTFDAYLILGGSKLGAFLNDIRRRNAIGELQAFTMYVVTLFVGEVGAYQAEMHTDCTITYDQIGGDIRINFPITVHYSNKITTGTVDKMAEDFVFTPDVTV